MTDYYLKFQSEEQAKAVLYDVKTKAPNYANIDTIGIIYKPTGKMLQGEDGTYPAMAPLEGWHVNVRLVGEDAIALEPYMVTPTAPIRIWG